MTDRIADMKNFFVIQKKHWEKRKPPLPAYEMAAGFKEKGLRDYERAARRLIDLLEKETPVIFPGEKIVFTRTIPSVPELFTEEEEKELRETHWIHERGDISNICVDYTMLLGKGFDRVREELLQNAGSRRENGQEESARYLELQEAVLGALQKLSERYREKAVQEKNETAASVLSRVPAKAPVSWLEALQMFRIIHFAMWLGGNYHNTVGRFDQYMYPYYKRDREKGIYTEETALELLEEFFLTFNRDSDLYPGMQQGDNGQSMVLGGKNRDGSDSYNGLSELCLKACLELKLIDPKINLRVHRDTPMETYILGTELTKQGLGFPQYSNDEVVIPGLLACGYGEEAAYDYAIAACWEFIIPGEAMDIPNIAALSFPEAVMQAVFENLEQCETYQQLEQKVYENIRITAENICEQIKNLYLYPAPFLSLMMKGCLEQGKDISLGCHYNNYGIHGTGLSTAADSLAAVKKYIYEEKELSPKELITALKKNFEGYETLCNRLRYETPKMGQNEDDTDQIGAGLLNAFADALQGKKNERGGIIRPGTGSAMYYLWHAKELPATPDGRRKGEGFGANYSPSLYSRCKGPVSIIQSFAKPDLKRVINGGPLTLELHDTLFRTEESVKKTAVMVKSFMELGGHQLQLNAVNRETMLDAQKHPEKYRNLIVRVWGWSGYFVELDKEYQDHIIQRMELRV